MFGMGTGVSPPLSSPNTPQFSLKRWSRFNRNRASRGTAPHPSGNGDAANHAPSALCCLSHRRSAQRERAHFSCAASCDACSALNSEIGRSSPRPISTAQLKGLPLLHPRPINQLVSLGSYPVDPVGDLILGWASHLDAFSAYPIQTWLPGGAPGGTTGALEVCPTRSSRTEVSSPQISCAHGG